MSKYDGAQERICRTGGAVRVSLSSGVGQGNGGTSLACAGCYVQAVAANTAVVRMNIGTDASATAGVDLARPYVYDGTDEASAATAQPLYVRISDVSQLYFYSTDVDAKVDILYLLG